MKQETTFNPDNYWESRLKKIKGLEGVGYSKLGPVFNKWAYKIRKVAFLGTASKIETKDKKVLDIGSGTGFYIQIWHELQAGKVTGVDITETAVENLKSIFPIDKFEKLDIGGDVSDFINRNGTFDCISCMDVLFHIVDDTRFREALVNIGKLTSKGGYFIYSDNFPQKKTWRTKHQVSHQKDVLEGWLKIAGFEIVSVYPFMYLSNYPLDTDSKLLRAYWWVVENTLAFIPFTGYVLGPLLFQIDKLLIKKPGHTPSSKILLLRKSI